MKPYNEQLALARRWDKCVDAGSPLTAQKPRKFGVQVKVWNPHKGEYEWLWYARPEARVTSGIPVTRRIE